jgi:hypothetical protein
VDGHLRWAVSANKRWTPAVAPSYYQYHNDADRKSAKKDVVEFVPVALPTVTEGMEVKELAWGDLSLSMRIRILEMK